MQGVIKSYDPGTGDGVLINETDFAEIDLAAAAPPAARAFGFHQHLGSV